MNTRELIAAYDEGATVVTGSAIIVEYRPRWPHDRAPWVGQGPRDCCARRFASADCRVAPRG